MVSGVTRVPQVAWSRTLVACTVGGHLHGHAYSPALQSCATQARLSRLRIPMALPDSHRWDGPAIDDVLAARDGRRAVRSQEGDQFGDFLRAVRPAERNAAEGLHDTVPGGLRAETRALRDFVDHALRRLGFSVAGRHGVDA